MFTVPEPAVRDRMLSARDHTCALLDVADAVGGEVWGYQAGRCPGP
ncbi:hypothetical protein [Streptomyces sp. NPDC055299]